LWSRFINNEFLEYSGKVSARETIQDKKTTLQSLFFQSKETEHLFALKQFLIEKYKSHTKIQENMGKFKDYVLNTDKHVELEAVHSLLMIPFFDGFYIRALDEKFMKKLPEYIKVFNMFYKKEHGIVFEEKEIKPDYTYFTKCPQKQKNFSSVTSFLRQTNNTLLVKRFIERLPGVNECLIKLRNLDITTSTYFQDVKQLNNEIKTHFIYTCLTSGNNFDNPDDVKNYIKKILLIKNPSLKEILPIELKYNKYDSNLFVESE
jgi:hypothetical protein